MRTRTPRPGIQPLLFAVCAGCASTRTSGVTPADGGPDVAPDMQVVVPPDAPMIVDARRDAPDAPDAPPSCGFEGASNVAITYTGFRDTPLDCRMPRGMPGGPATVDARRAEVTSVTDDAMGSTVALDFCSPAADCIAMPGSLRLNAPGLNLGASPVGLRRGQFVRIRARATWSWGCTMQVEVSNAPTWDGQPNPVRRDGALLVAAASGEASALPDAPFGLSRRSIGCVSMGSDCGGGRPELFALAFQGRCNTCETDPDPVVVRQGRTATFGINGLTYVGTNLRSYNSGACDDYWNYAWTAREIWLE